MSLQDKMEMIYKQRQAQAKKERTIVIKGVTLTTKEIIKLYNQNVVVC
ncbi:hypothetical protein AAXB25_14760 [Paenibacillus lautus]